MDPINPIKNSEPEPNDLSFQVMPQGQNFEGGGVPLAPKMPIKSGEKLPTPSQQNYNDVLPEEPSPSFFRSKLLYVIIALLILAGLALGAYFLLGFGQGSPTEQEVAQSKLPKPWLNQYFGAETCVDQTVCGEEADGDNDGLSNYDEFKEGTDPTLNDSDSDGLADGDEVNIYKTDPKDPYTDKRAEVELNDWKDAIQIHNGYDPLTPGLKFTDTRTAQISSDTTTYGLHEPTITSLNQSENQSTPLQ